MSIKLSIASTGVPISYAGPPTAASGEILATHVIPEALQLVLVEGVDPAEAGHHTQQCKGHKGKRKGQHQPRADGQQQGAIDAVGGHRCAA